MMVSEGTFLIPNGENRFQGPQSDVATWFSSQWHAVRSSVQSIAELNVLLAGIEAACCSKANSRNFWVTANREVNFIDAVAISHEFTDHCNRATLLELDQQVPIFAPRIAANLIKSWSHFACVFEMPEFSGKQNDWRHSSISPLPKWVSIARMAPEDDSLYYHSAILVAFDLQDQKTSRRNLKEGTAEAVIYTPHGIRAETVRHLPDADPEIKTLVLVHGLHDIKLTSKQLNLGAHNGLQVQRSCNAKYWVTTHDEIKLAKGIIAPFLSRKIFTLQDALKKEKEDSILVDGEGDWEPIVHADLASGESLLLA